jgi:hypothetical protein
MRLFHIQHLAPLAAMLLVAPSWLMAQGLAAPVARWANDFSRVTGVAELPDGRVVIVDSRDGLVFLGTANGGTAAQLGRTGEGPNEYQRPFSVFHGQADTLLVYTTAGRLVRISPTGVIQGSHQFSPGTLGGSISAPRGTDSRGRIYWDRPVIRVPGSNEIKRQQLYEIVRFMPGTDNVELVATASDHAPERHDQRFHPFAERDAWELEPDGTVLVVKARDYSLQWIRERTALRTADAIEHAKVPLTAADREAYRRDRAANPSGMAMGGAPAVRDGEVTPEAMAKMREAYPDAQFPPHKPPFVERGAFRSPGGHLWVVRSPAGVALKGTHIDILDSAGRRIRELDLPVGRQLVALERNGVYLVREDDDGLQYLERYTWPRGLR